jgi:hypothetical protein
MGRRVAVITKDRDRQYEALRSGLGLLLERHSVSLFVLNHEIDGSEAYLDNLGFIDEMGGDRYSDHPVNVERHGFRPVSTQEAGRLLAEHDLVIPF